MLAGGGPAATHFSCLAKKSKQKKAAAQSLPCGFPFVRSKKWEMDETRLRLRQRPFLIHFLLRTNGSAKAERQRQRQRSPQNQGRSIHGPSIMEMLREAHGYCVSVSKLLTRHRNR
ncbi:hypothetical protein ACFOFO_14450 [Undibacterium arcticum]|uniref:Transposase n=1 Tax=Undibacterium arcticum TaxID=1762892 RepID=A0ABV7F256_9BURK